MYVNFYRTGINEVPLALKPDVFQRAIVRGKGLLRAQSTERRQNQIDRWQLYEWLKGNCLAKDCIPLVETMSSSELREGCLEYLSSILYH